MQNLTQPTLLLKPFCQDGDKNQIPIQNDSLVDPQLADLTNGFPEITSKLPSQGGLPPERKDFNALGYLTTSYDWFYQAGGTFTFNQTISDAIGGYPLNARLWYTDSNGVSCVLRSTIPNNTNNFLLNPSVIGNQWVIENFIGTRLNTNYVTNCITDIPQDIKLELDNGTLILKAGSKVYVPNGFEQNGTTPKFDTVTFQNDVLCYTGYTTSAKRLMTYLNTEGQVQGVSITYFYSGDTAKMNSTTAYDYARFYNTTTNKMYRGNSSNVWVEVYQSLPIATATNDSSGKYTLNHIFNGFGYMGSTVFALPGVKGLIPNGRNADGTLKSIEFTVSSVLTNQNTGSNRNGTYIQYYNGTLTLNRVNKDAYYYNEQENQYRKISDNTITERILVANTVGDISSFSSSSAFHALDYNDRGIISGFGMPSNKYISLTLGASGTSYTAPANGWFHIAKTAGTASAYILATASNGYEVALCSPTTTFNMKFIIPVNKGDSVRFSYNATGSTNAFKFFYSQGEV